MDTIFMNLKDSKKIRSNRLLLNLREKTNLNRVQKNIALSYFSILWYITKSMETFDKLTNKNIQKN